MTTGSSIFLIAVGAILRYAVTATVSGISLQTVGLILIIAGAIGLVLSLFYMLANPRREQVVRDRVIEREPYEDPSLRP
jgi:TRAP-type C4-dicarboxylate transport system permease small subunit